MWQSWAQGQVVSFCKDAPTFLVSLVFHVLILVALLLIPIAQKIEPPQLLITSQPTLQERMEKELELPQDFYYSDIPAEQVGASSQSEAETEGTLAEAPLVASETAIPSLVDVEFGTEVPEFEIDNTITQATGQHYNANLAIKGAAGQGTTGAAGAVDRLTHEILLSLEERKTLVVWVFDQSPSMIRQRKEVLARFDKIYQELGVIEASENAAFKKHDSKPLLTSIVCFGDKVSLLTKKPTDNLAEIKAAVEKIPADESGIERIFSAIYMAADQYKSYRAPVEGSRDPNRNVMIIAFTDEAGEDQTGLDETVKICRRYEMPVYVVGVPAPFGQKQTMVKWVDPDPKFDQTAGWGAVDQGPETFLPERVKLDFVGSREEEEPIDSGFGPYALTRLCYETGGIFFTVHPNRRMNRAVSRGEVEAFSAHIKYFFDPDVMRKYRPDYVPLDEYKKRVSQNKARGALIDAAQLSSVTPMDNPRYRFLKQSEAEFATALSEAQRDAASLEPKLEVLYQKLQAGEADRPKETGARWQAGYDLAMGRVMAVKVRTEAYNAMLAQAKTGLKFKNEKNNTWVLDPADTISVGSQLEKMAQKANMYLKRVVNDHPGTPWAMLAQRELETPMGWTWKEQYTEIAPPRPANPAPPNNNNPPPAAVNDAAMMLKQPPPKRPIPKL